MKGSAWTTGAEVPGTEVPGTEVPGTEVPGAETAPSPPSNVFEVDDSEEEESSDGPEKGPDGSIFEVDSDDEEDDLPPEDPETASNEEEVRSPGPFYF